jgi:5-methylcytosine-specific restriction endonuclease McrA
MSHSVLVLNANYEPINVCEVRRAIGLVLTDRALLVLNGRGEIHTCTVSYPRPSVIRLHNMVHRPRPQLKLTRREIFRRDNYTCQYCGKTTTILTIDHIQPRHLGGLHTWTNVVAACSFCNHKKGGRALEDLNMQLLKPPKEPPTSASYIFKRHLLDNHDWEPYIANW